MPPSTTLGASPNLAGIAAKSAPWWLYEHCTKLKCGCKKFIINELLVEAAGVELIATLQLRNRHRAVGRWRLGSDITGGLPGTENAPSDNPRPAIENQLQFRRMISRILLRSLWIQPHQTSCREDSRSHPTRRRAGCILCRIA